MKTLNTIHKIFFVCAFALVLSFSANAQLTVSSGLSGQDLVDILTSGASGVEISNVSLVSPGTSSGSFSGGIATGIGIEDGILLTSGSVNVAPGPNNQPGAGVDNGAGGDSDLGSLVPQQTYDACYLQFDVVPVGNTITFKYVFASEEYREYYCTTFNDVFAFFVTGGVYSNENIALAPSGDPVSINNVGPSDDPDFPCGGIDNSASYVDNPQPGATLQYDGYTVVLTATVAVERCQTYTFKLAIADAGDGVLDSGVFIEAGSFESNEVLATAEVTAPECPNGTDGAIDLTIQGGQEPYSFVWSPGGETSEDLSGLAPGDYSVVITDGDGCTQTNEFTVPEGMDTEPPLVSCADMTVELDENGNASLALPSTGTLSAEIKGNAGFCPADAVEGLCCDCPPGYVAVGYEALVGNNYGNVVSQFSLICQQLNPDGTLGAGTTTTCSNGNLVSGAPTGQVLASSGSVLVGAGVRLGCAMDQVQGYSLPIADVLGGTANSTGSPVTAIGGAGGGARPIQYAPDGNVIVGMHTYTDEAGPYSGSVDGICAGVAWRYAPLQEVINASNFSYSDNCCIASASLSDSDYNCDDVGTPLSIDLTVTDESGNAAACGFTLTVEDNLPPVASCQDLTVNLDASGMASINDDDLDDGSTDNCGIDYFDTDITDFDCADAYDYFLNPGSPIVATLTITDVNGNSSTCTGTVTVLYSGNDADCDGIGDECDLCENGDDSVDFNGDGIPDCSQGDLEEYSPEWACNNPNSPNAKIFVCHRPPGDEGNFQTLCVSPNALGSHLEEHPDWVGPCSSCLEDAKIKNVEDVLGSDATFTVYPNPATDILVISNDLISKGNAQIRISDGQGKVVWTRDFDEPGASNTQQVNIQEETSILHGVYFVSVVTDSEVQTKSVVIIK